MEKVENLRLLVLSTFNKRKAEYEKIKEQFEYVKSQAEMQSNNAIRTLLLELETGGNARFEDEQKSSQWIAHCEKQIKKLIKRAASKESPKSIQIHRISRFYNRGSKLRFDEKAQGNGSPEKCNYLCLNVKSKDYNVFSIAENGFGGIEDQKPILMTNYFDCQENISQEPTKLRKLVIVRCVQMCHQAFQGDLKDFEAITKQDYPAADAVTVNISKNVDGDVNDAEAPKKVLIINKDYILPEYLVEFSLESDFQTNTTPLQQLLLDITYSNRISHANMPSIVQELASKMISQQEKPTPLMDELREKYTIVGELLNLKKSAVEYQKLLLFGRTPNDYLNLTGVVTIQSDYFALRNFLTTIIINHAKLEKFPSLQVCPLLEHLDLSFNAITTIPPLTTEFPKLKALYLASNQISTLSELERISNVNLAELDIRFNPATLIRDYDIFLIKKIPCLVKLNDQDIFASKWGGFPGDWNSLLLCRSSDQVESFRPLSIRTLYGRESSSLEHNYYRKEMPKSIAQKFVPELITTLELDQCQLLNLDKLPNQYIIILKLVNHHFIG